MRTADFAFEALRTTGVPSDLAEELFPIERDTFGDVYERCPRSLEAYEARYDGRDLYHVICRHHGRIFGHRTFQRVTAEHIESMFMVVKESYRGLGLSSLICELSAAWLRWLGYRWVSSWTHVDLTAAQILARYAPFISTAPDLDPAESVRLREIEANNGLQPEAYGSSRIIKDFYTMRDGRVGDARYWVHDLAADEPQR